MTYTATPAKMHSGHDIRDDKGHMVAIVHNPASNPAEGARIAALMAAAPELLAALEAVLELHIAHHNHPTHAAARATIARAKGAA